MASQPDDKGKLELAIRILGNELIGFKMEVDDFKMKATNPPQALLKSGEP